MSDEKTTIEQDALEYLRLMVQLQMQRCPRCGARDQKEEHACQHRHDSAATKEGKP